MLLFTQLKSKPISEMSVGEVLEIEQRLFNLVSHFRECDFAQLHTV
jgi:hypothetical protein